MLGLQPYQAAKSRETTTATRTATTKKDKKDVQCLLSRLIATNVPSSISFLGLRSWQGKVGQKLPYLVSAFNTRGFRTRFIFTTSIPQGDLASSMISFSFFLSGNKCKLNYWINESINHSISQPLNHPNIQLQTIEQPLKGDKHKHKKIYTP